MNKTAALTAVMLWAAAPAFADVVTVRLQRPPRPEVQIPFPDIRDWKSLRITLRRSTCFGPCPDYSVEIDGAGNVSYEGHDYVAVAGKHRGKASAPAVRDLFLKFKKADFYWLFDAYQSSVTDNPAYEIAISFDGHTKRVVDYVGEKVGMPKDVGDLENQIDVVAGTKKWIQGTGETFASLKSEGWDFRSSKITNRKLLVAASGEGSSGLADQLLTAGVPTDGQYGCEAVAQAASNGNTKLVSKLIGAGAAAFWPHAQNKTDLLCNALTNAAEGGDEASVRAILDQRPNKHWLSRPLEAVAENAYQKGRGKNYIAVLQLLLAAGADVKSKGQRIDEPILSKASDPAAVKLLIAAGADVNARSRSGPPYETPLQNQIDAESARLLLEHGADPYAIDSQGITIVETLDVKGYKEAAKVVRQWMASHPKPRR